MENIDFDKLASMINPDFEEGPDSRIREEQFYDAIDSHYEKIEKDERRLQALHSISESIQDARTMPSNHPLKEEIDRKIEERIALFKLSPKVNNNGELIYNEEVSSFNSPWQIILQNGPMTIYNRELESENGIVLDPLQAVHTVDNVTAKEFCTVFWDVRHRMNWEITVDQPPTVLEVCSDDTIILHQIYTRVWPATQREAVMWSHIRELNIDSISDEKSLNNSEPNTGILDAWCVVNMSTTYKDDKLETSPFSLIRLGLDVILLCQTIVTLPKDEKFDPNRPKTNYKRDQLKCRIFYAADINPGGWAPAKVVRQLARREYPRFLIRISDYVQKTYNEKDPLL